ncbi:MAG: anhydro-N-acetylmuramic acid kinase [Planctomycetota bacterium]
MKPSRDQVRPVPGTGLHASHPPLVAPGLATVGYQSRGLHELASEASAMAIEATGWSIEPTTRLFAGVSFGRRSGRLKISLLRCRGEGWSLRCVSADAMTAPPPSRELESIADAIRSGLGQLARQSQIPVSAIDVVGIAKLPDDNLAPMLANLIAESTGITVVSGFDLRDRSCGGRGGPLSPLADWFLFRSTRLGRLIIQLGPALRVTVLGAGDPPQGILCFDSGPCCDFLDGLTRQLSQGKYPFDPSGHFAVQGRVSEELVSQWSSHPYLLRPPPKFLDPQQFDAPLRESSLAFAREQRLNARDVLRSANQFVIECFQEALRRFVPSTKRIDEAWVTGGGSWNGLLWKLLREALDPIPVARTDEIGIPSEARGSIHAALLAYFAMEHLPANLPTMSGASKPLVLGQITPGSTDNWSRWIFNLADRIEFEESKAA